MLLNSKDKQAAMDYTIFMMVGSFFDKTETASPGKEKIYHLRYQLLGHKTQYEIVEFKGFDLEGSTVGKFILHFHFREEPAQEDRDGFFSGQRLCLLPHNHA